MSNYIDRYRDQIESLGDGVVFGGPHIHVYGGKAGAGGGIRIGAGSEFYDFCQFHTDDMDGCWIRIGRNCHFNFGCYICGTGGLTIGDDCLFGPGVKLIPADHNFDDLSRPIQAQGHTLAPITIGSNVWLGAGVIVLPGVTIGSGAVVGAGGVVTRALPENGVAVGIPARVIRYRGERPSGRPADP
jgi:acetyltransferase-like isoleucine patch superfamily enzyme